MKHQYVYAQSVNANKYLQYMLHLPFFRALIKDIAILQRWLSSTSQTVCALYVVYTLLQGIPFYRACPSTGHDALLQGTMPAVNYLLNLTTRISNCERLYYRTMFLTSEYHNVFKWCVKASGITYNKNK